MIKNISIIFSIITISILLSLLIFSPYKKVSNQEEINNLRNNEKAISEGKVISERNFGDLRIVTLDNEIEIICNCKNILDENIIVKGKIEDFSGKKRLIPYTLMLK